MNARIVLCSTRCGSQCSLGVALVGGAVIGRSSARNAAKLGRRGDGRRRSRRLLQRAPFPRQTRVEGGRLAALCLSCPRRNRWASSRFLRPSRGRGEARRRPRRSGRTI